MPPVKKSDAEAEALGRSTCRNSCTDGCYTKIHALVDALGNPLTFILTPGQAGDYPQAESLLAFCGGEEQKTAIEAVLADKGYDSSDLAQHIESEFEAEAVIPSRKNANHPREIDRELYKDRNKIERFIGRVKHYRRVATRNDKTARNYVAFLHVAFLHVASIMTLSVNCKPKSHRSVRPRTATDRAPALLHGALPLG